MECTKAYCEAAQKRTQPSTGISDVFVVIHILSFVFMGSLFVNMKNSSQLIVSISPACVDKGEIRFFDVSHYAVAWNVYLSRLWWNCGSSHTRPTIFAYGIHSSTSSYWLEGLPHADALAFVHTSILIIIGTIWRMWQEGHSWAGWEDQNSKMVQRISNSLLPDCWSVATLGRVNFLIDLHNLFTSILHSGTYSIFNPFLPFLHPSLSNGSTCSLYFLCRVCYCHCCLAIKHGAGSPSLLRWLVKLKLILLIEKALMPR